MNNQLCFLQEFFEKNFRIDNMPLILTCYANEIGMFDDWNKYLINKLNNRGFLTILDESNRSSSLQSKKINIVKDKLSSYKTCISYDIIVLFSNAFNQDIFNKALNLVSNKGDLFYICITKDMIIDELFEYVNKKVSVIDNTIITLYQIIKEPDKIQHLKIHYQKYLTGEDIDMLRENNINKDDDDDASTCDKNIDGT